MKTATRPQYHRLQRILELIREGTRAGSLPNCGHFTRELEVSRRTLMRDLDFLRDDHHAPIAYDDSRKGMSVSGSGTRASGCSGDETGGWSLSWKPQAARN